VEKKSLLGRKVGVKRGRKEREDGGLDLREIPPGFVPGDSHDDSTGSEWCGSFRIG